MERNSRKTFIGRVVSTGMDKTITVVVESKKEHTKYKKQQIRTKKYKSHDEKEIAQMGDLVKIMETKPYSATKRSMLIEVLEKGIK